MNVEETTDALKPRGGILELLVTDDRDVELRAKLLGMRGVIEHKAVAAPQSYEARVEADRNDEGGHPKVAGSDQWIEDPSAVEVADDVRHVMPHDTRAVMWDARLDEVAEIDLKRRDEKGIALRVDEEKRNVMVSDEAVLVILKRTLADHGDPSARANLHGLSVHTAYAPQHCTNLPPDGLFTQRACCRSLNPLLARVAPTTRLRKTACLRFLVHCAPSDGGQSELFGKRGN